MSLWNEVKSNLAEWYTVTSEKTSELARISTRRYDKFGISREIERQFSELGNFVYVGLKEGDADLLEHPTVQGLVERIQELEEELRAKDEEIEDIRSAYARGTQEEKEADGRSAATEPEADAKEAAERRDESAATVLTDPVLEPGSDESAILVEPGAEEPKERPSDPAV